MSDSIVHRFGFVGLVGRPNVGKSTLLNALVGQKVSIVTRRPQTTRHRILGVVTRNDSQLALVDTPGMHATRRGALNPYMNRMAVAGRHRPCAFLVEAKRWTDDTLVLENIKRRDVRRFSSSTRSIDLKLAGVILTSTNITPMTTKKSSLRSAGTMSNMHSTL